jgi:sarcosine oxidase subunit alpha
VSAAMLSAGAACRISVSGEPRTALCGMGICFECRAVVDGVPHQRTCQLLCREGMRVETQS